MGIFGVIFGETNREKAERWREELLKLLENKFNEGHELEFAEDDGDLLIRQGQTHLLVSFEFLDEGDKEDAQGYMLIQSPLSYLPKKNILPFYRKLLDLNNGLIGSLATTENYVSLKRITAIDSLTEGGCLADVGSILDEAEETTELLIDEFKVSRCDLDKDE